MSAATWLFAWPRRLFSHKQPVGDVEMNYTELKVTEIELRELEHIAENQDAGETDAPGTPLERTDYHDSICPMENGCQCGRDTWLFVRKWDNIWRLAAFVGGTSLIIAVFIFTFWLERQTVLCPGWAVDCAVSPTVQWLNGNNAFLSTVVGLVYTCGLGMLGYAAQTFAEAAMWPLLNEKQLLESLAKKAEGGNAERAEGNAEIEDIDRAADYLSGIRSGIREFWAIHRALGCFRSPGARTIIIISSVVSLITYTSPLVGFVYNQESMMVKYKSEHQTAGGIGRIYAQTYPLTSNAIDGGTVFWYASYIKGLPEPMPESRTFIIPRHILAERGDLTVNAPRYKLSTFCKPFNLTQIDPGQDKPLKFASEMAKHNGPRAWNSSDHVEIRSKPAMAAFGYDFSFHSPTRSSATVVFTAIHGHIEGGQKQILLPFEGNLTYTSSIACDIDIELFDDVLRVGTAGGDEPTQTLGTVQGLHIGHPNSTTNASLNTKNEVALWHAMAPVLCGVSVDGKQPMFFQNREKGGLPVPYTSTNFNENNNWTIQDIERFIGVGVGAFALSISTAWDEGMPKIMMTSSIKVQKLNPYKAYLLLILPVVLLGLMALLIRVNACLHFENHVPEMRLVKISDVTEYIRMKHEEARYKKLKRLQVRPAAGSKKEVLADV